MVHVARFTLVSILALASPVPSSVSAEGTWKLVANHLHSSAGGDSHWSRGIRHIRQFCAENRIDHGILTDHDTIGGWFDPAFDTGPGAVLIRGQEWTSVEGHANLVNFSASGPQDAVVPEVPGDYDGVPPRPRPAAVIDHARTIRAVHARGGLVFINHPALRGYRWPDQTFGADACEVNGTWENPSGANAKAWYARRLMAGQRIGAVGGSDYHYLRPKRRGVFTPDIEKPINLVRVEGEGVPGVLAGFRARHVQVLASPAAPRCELSIDAITGLLGERWGDTQGDGRPDGIGGDIRTVKAGQSVKLTARVTGGKGQKLTFHDVVSGAGAEYTTSTLAITSDDFTFTVVRSGSGSGRRCTYCEVGSLKTLTNPIWY